MAKVIFTDSGGTERSVDTLPRESVMRAALRNGVPGIVGECGGSLSCATCHVYVQGGDIDGLAEVSEMEDEMLDGAVSPRREESRLSCQLHLEDNGVLFVTTPIEQ